MAKQELEPEKYNPDDNLKVFATRSLLMWLVVAMVIHVLLIGGTSVGYVVKTVFKTEQSDEEQAQTEESGETEESQQDTQEDEDDQEEGSEAETEEGDSKDDAESDSDSEDADDSEKSQEELMEERKESEVIQEAGETASPEEIPENPEDIDLDIDDTN